MEALVWPCFIGPSGCGKTTSAHVLAKQRECQLNTVLLGTIQPEEFGGAPRAVDVEGDSKSGFFKWFLPSFAFEEHGMLFMDELDKAERGHWASILTTLTSLKIRDHSFPSDTEILTAMQPVSRDEFLADSTGEALAARLCFLPMKLGDSVSYVSRKHGGVDLAWFNVTRPANESVLPTNLSPRGLDWLLGFSRWCIGRDDGRNILYTVALGLATVDQTAAIMNSVDDLDKTNPDSFISALLRDESRVDKLPLATVHVLLPHIWSHPDSTLTLLEKAMTRFLAETPIESVSDVQKELIDHLIDRCKSNPDGEFIEVFGNATEVEVSEAIASASRTACKYRLDEIGAAKRSSKTAKEATEPASRASKIVSKASK